MTRPAYCYTSSMAVFAAPGAPAFDFSTERVGPIRSVEFEAWAIDPDNPYELLAGWVVPMSPGNVRTGQFLPRLAALLLPLADRRGWNLIVDGRHRLPDPHDTVVFPDLALHCSSDVPVALGTDTALRVPDLVIEILGDETAARDRGPAGVKFAAYEASGVREYYHVWPDGSEAAAYRRTSGHLVAIAADADGFFASDILGGRFRLVPPALL